MIAIVLVAIQLPIIFAHQIGYPPMNNTPKRNRWRQLLDAKPLLRPFGVNECHHVVIQRGEAGHEVAE